MPEQECFIELDRERLTFILRRSSRRRSFSVMINDEARVCVSVPVKASQKDVLAFVSQHQKWILTRLHQARARQQAKAARCFDHGHCFLFLGKSCVIEVVEKKVKQTRIQFDGSRWLIAVPESLPMALRRQKIRDKLIQWYRLQAKEILGGRIFHYGRILGKQPRKIVVRTQKRMWGCCYYQRQAIYLNWQIILSPLEVIDYVVTHELCHLFYPNHSPAFWRKLARVIPDYQKHRRWLKEKEQEGVFL